MSWLRHPTMSSRHRSEPQRDSTCSDPGPARCHAGGPEPEDEPMAYYRLELSASGEHLVPEPDAVATWSAAGQIGGTAVSGALARAAEQRADLLSDPERFRPVRWNVDLFRPADLVPSTVSTTVVRAGRRLRLLDARFLQGNIVTARASLLLIATGSEVTATTWTAPSDPFAPLPFPTGAHRWFSEDVGWTCSPTTHPNASRKAVRMDPVDIVQGEKPTPFQNVAALVDAANLVANWGERGVEYINADLVLHLSRTPAQVGGLVLATTHRAEGGGIAVGAVSVSDEHGPLGSVIVDAVANSAHAVGPETFARY